MKRKSVIGIVFSCIVTSFIALATTAISFAWFISKRSAEDQAIDGSVGLRDYFYNGDGYYGDGNTPQTAYEIVTPIHFYNLTRLQSLGVFSSSTTTKYFKIGHVFEGHEEEGPKCLAADGETKVDVLDMTSFCSASPVLPVGSEGTPFYGVFDGQNVPVVGLRVAGDPEDIGVFGYTAHNSMVQNLICKNLEVSALGYPNEDDAINFVYSQSVENIFQNSQTNFEQAYLEFYDGNNHNGLKTLTPYVLKDLASHLDQENPSWVQGRFVLHSIPTYYDGYKIEYSLSSSTGVIVPPDRDSKDLIIDTLKYPNELLYPSDPVQMKSRISVVASVVLGGITYSRVIQTYDITIDYGSITVDQVVKNGYSLRVDCSHVGEEGSAINYAHGNNIGYIIGHADGKAQNCYVYNGSIVLNNDDESLTNIRMQSETGLIGLIGNNVTTDIDPTNSATTNGETGVLNFSYIYDQIRTPFIEGETVRAGRSATYNPTSGDVDGPQKSFIAYAKNVSGYGPHGVSESFDKYKEFLRTDDNNPCYYITSAANAESIPQGLGSDYVIPAGGLNEYTNSVDFTWNKVICDGSTDETKRGLGVFKIVTNYSDLPKNDSIKNLIWRNDIGDCSIRNDSNPKTAIYFSTAEADWSKETPTDWNPQRMNTTPSFSDVGSFEYPFSRDFDYVFKLDLNEADHYKIGNEIYNYMYNTDNPFLINYLSSILINRLNQPVPHRNKAFGFKVQFSQSIETPVTSLSSYMVVKQPTRPQQYTYDTIDGEETSYLPPSSVVFNIDNPNGANVSVAGCGGYISIYSYKPGSNDMPKELFTMKSNNRGTNNYGRAFDTSDVAKFEENGEQVNTKTVVTPQANGMKDSEYLFGHTFKLPRGSYVIGASKKMKSTEAKLYYVCVQGQTNGDIGEKEVATIGNVIKDIDFLLVDPTTTTLDLEDDSQFAKFSFNGGFTEDIGKVVVDTFEVEDPQTHEITKYLRIRFNNCITGMQLYCRKEDQYYKVNSDIIEDIALYEGPYEDFTDWSQP